MRLYGAASKMCYMMAGLGIGAGVALLFAPRSGKESRRFIARKAEDSWGQVTSVGKEIRTQAEGVVSRGRGWAARFVQ